MSKKILIVGAGFSGLSAAFYLAQNEQFDITVVEMNETSGGLCYTENINGVPFEHTFRLFSETGYPTVKEILSEIPSGKKTIWENLIQVEISFFVQGKISKVKSKYQMMRLLGITNYFLFTYMKKLLFGWLMGNRLKNISYFDYIGKVDFARSKLWKVFEILTGAKSYSSASSILGLQKVAAFQNWKLALNGPTKINLIDPIINYLEKKNVKFMYASKIVDLEIHTNRLISMKTDKNDFKADHFFYTLNHITNDLFLKDDYSDFFPDIENVDSINREWDLSLMIGLKTIIEDIPIGVVICPESAWSIGFTQYALHESSTWNHTNIKFPESVKSFIHILILNTEKGDPKHPVPNKIAKECTKEELLENALYQIGMDKIPKSEIISYEVDPRWQILSLEEYVKNADKIFSKNIYLSRKQVVVSNTQLYRFKPNEQKYLQNSKTEISNLNFIGECVNGSTFPVPTLEFVAEVSKNSVREFMEQV
jgi:myosin-crossreactive antigen